MYFSGIGLVMRWGNGKVVTIPHSKPTMTSQPEIDRLKKQLSRYIDAVRSSCQDGEIDDRTRHRLETRYNELFEKYQNISIDKVNKYFTPQEIQAINFMSLGMENGLAVFYKETAAFFEVDANRTAIAVAGFIKSRRAYDLVHMQKGGDLNQQQMEQLARLYGSLLGVQLTREFVRSVRTEEMGRIFGYAVSGLCERDMGAWHADASLRSQYKGSLDKYLADVIASADKQASYRFTSDLEESGQFLAAFKINESIHAQRGQVRGRNLVDHCFIHHNPDGSSGTITLGTSTAESHAEKHGYSFAASVLAAQAMVERKTISGRPNPYYGYKIKTYCFMAGFMPTTTLEGDVERSPVVQMIEKGRPAGSELSLSQVLSIAKLPFLSLFASEDPSPLLSRGLSEINPVISGCDTLSDYGTLVNETRQKKTYKSSRRLGVYVLGQVAKVSQLLAQGNSRVDLGDVGPQKVLRSGLETLVGVVQNYGSIFPIDKDKKNKLQEREVELLVKIATDFTRIADKIKASNSDRGRRIAKSLSLVASSITTPSKVLTQMLQDGDDVRKFDVDVVHSDILYDKIDMLGKLYTSQEERKSAARSIANLIKSGQAHVFFDRLLDMTREACDFTAEQSSFWSDWVDALNHSVQGRAIDEWKGMHFQDRDALLKGKEAFVAGIEKGPLRNLVVSLDNLVSQKGPKGRADLHERLGHDKMKNTVLPSVVKSFVSVARAVDDDEAVALLRSLTIDQAPSPRSRRRP